MKQRIRRLLCAVILATAVGGLVAGPAQALTITGGTPEQRAYAREVAESTSFDLARLDAYFPRGIQIKIKDHWDPYWDLGPMADELSGVAGLAYFNGVIIVRSMEPARPGSFFGIIVAHELGHLFWFTLPADAWLAWGEMVGGDGRSWLTNRAESFAEHAKVFAFPPAYIGTEGIRSDLRTVDRATFWAFCKRWTTTTTTLPSTPPPPPTSSTTTTTTVRGEPFPDVDRSDLELFEAAWWGRENAVLLGYLDGRLHPYDILTRRHAALMIGRAGGAVKIMWVFDYGVPSRGELAALYPDWTWDPGRESEPLLRSQLLRQLWRAR